MVKNLILSAAAVLALGVAGAPPVQAATDQQQAVNDAMNVVQHLGGGNDDLSRQTRDLLHRGRAVLIVPQLVKAGFMFGGQGGTGVLLARGPKGTWSDPAFYDMGAGSFGLQIGVEVSRVMLIIMTDKALNAVLENKVKLGAEAGLAIATLGAGGEASTTTATGADIYAVAESKGLFGGIAIEGGVMAPNSRWDRDYYGHTVSARDIVLRRTVSNPGDVRLRRVLDGL